MNDIEKGRKIVIAIIAILMFTSLAVICTFILHRGLSQLPPRIMRFLLTGLLCWFLYKGFIWAKWLVVVFLGLGGFLSFAMSFKTGFLNAESYFLSLLGIIYVVAIGFLLFSKDVACFLNSRKK